MGDLMGSTLIKGSFYIHIPGASDPLNAETYGLQRISIRTPAECLDYVLPKSLQQLQIADPAFNKPAGVDVIIRADLYDRILLPGLIRQDRLLAQNTVFGWILTRRLDSSSSTPSITTLGTTIDPVEELWHERLINVLQRFWALEELPRIERRSPEDKDCERINTENHSRDNEGRYSVPLSLKRRGRDLLGSSLERAHAALFSVHHKLQRDKKLRTEYQKFMDCYLTLGHMRPATEADLLMKQGVHYLPHHGIWQRSTEGLKLRVVFNVSSPTSTGHSLNDSLYAGPKLQNELYTILTQWRTWQFVFCADIRMMFRQVPINPADTHLQRVLWSPSKGIPPVHYVLTTITYGEACALYPALRTLHQLCVDEGNNFPEAVKAIKKELYVDDFLCVASTLAEASLCQSQLKDLLRMGGFELKKWVTNHTRLLDQIPKDDRFRPNWFQLASDGSVNELGISWDAIGDCFNFTPPLLNADRPPTKRRVLAAIARLFDAAGWLAPVVLVAKMILQDLWCAKLGWDESLPRSYERRRKKSVEPERHLQNHPSTIDQVDTTRPRSAPRLRRR